MYPFDSVAWAWDELWAAVHERTPWTPSTLTRSGDLHARWHDAHCIVTQVCGWPFAAVHGDDMSLVGAFSLDLPEAEPPAHYRAVVVGSAEVDIDGINIDGIDLDRTHAAVNATDSLSGWHSLRAATVGPGREWPGTVTVTSTHRNSVAALANGEADLACIDPWSLAFITAEEPHLVGGLHRLGLGPLVPTPAITARTSVDEGLVRELRGAFGDAVADPAVAGALAALHIAGFVQMDLSDYLATLPLGDGR